MKKERINMYIENVEVFGIEPALRGMRNPLDSWHLGDTKGDWVGPKDMKLAQTLIGAGGEHRKFMRQIQVWADVSLPRYIWQELDTYMFGTKNSCSTMHTLFKKEITIDDFYLGDDPIIMTVDSLNNHTIPLLNEFRELYQRDKDYRWVKEMKRVLPESFLQMRTWNTNYEELRNIYHQRKHHKMNQEWKVVLEFIEDLPYAEEFIIN